MFSKDKFKQFIKDQLNDLNSAEKADMFESFMSEFKENFPVDEFEKLKTKYMKSRNFRMKGNPMRDMMSGMMSDMMSGMMSDERKSKMKNHPMMSMCMEMMGDSFKTTEEKSEDNKGSFGTDELFDLFTDWCLQVEDEIADHVKETGSVNEKEIAERFHLSEASVQHLLKKMKEAGRI